jgi:hypothetical protein
MHFTVDGLQAPAKEPKPIIGMLALTTLEALFNRAEYEGIDVLPWLPLTESTDSNFRVTSVPVARVLPWSTYVTKFRSPMRRRPDRCDDNACDNGSTSLSSSSNGLSSFQGRIRHRQPMGIGLANRWLPIVRRASAINSSKGRLRI